MKTFSLAAILLALLSLTACGGGGGGNTTPTPTPAPPPAVAISPSLLPEGIAGTPYSVTLSALFGTGPYNWILSDGLPVGFSFDTTTGILSGVVPADNPGFSVPLHIAVSDAVGHSSSAAFTLNIFGLSQSASPIPQVNVDSGIAFFSDGGTPPYHFTISGTTPPGLNFQPIGDSRSYGLLGKPTVAGHYSYTVQVTDSYAPAYSISHNFTVDVEPAALILNKVVPTPAVVGKAYSYQFGFKGGAAPFHWTIGTLPKGFTLDANTGTLTGTAASPLYAPFRVSVTDSSAPNQQNSYADLWLLASPAPLAPRNDTIATATPIIAGDANTPAIYDASISPFGAPAGTSAPDQDYYVLTAAAGTKFQFIVNTSQATQLGGSYSTLEPVLEIVDANGRRLMSCNDPFLDNVPTGVPVTRNTSPNFTDPCMNFLDPSDAAGQTSSLQFLAPGNSGNVTFYIHVFDFRGDARPDMQYKLYVSTK